MWEYQLGVVNTKYVRHNCTWAPLHHLCYCTCASCLYGLICATWKIHYIRNERKNCHAHIKLSLCIRSHTNVIQVRLRMRAFNPFIPAFRRSTQRSCHWYTGIYARLLALSLYTNCLIHCRYPREIAIIFTIYKGTLNLSHRCRILACQACVFNTSNGIFQTELKIWSESSSAYLWRI